MWENLKITHVNKTKLKVFVLTSQYKFSSHWTTTIYAELLSGARDHSISKTFKERKRGLSLNKEMSSKTIKSFIQYPNLFSGGGGIEIFKTDIIVL